jgi:hypothetical protein
MNKTEQLLKMLEHPERYSEQQWQEILADDECRELYSLMAKARSVFAAEQADERLTDEMINEQWQRLEAEHSIRATIVPLWRKVAAAAVVAVATIGIAVAAIHTGFFGLKHTDNKTEQTTKPQQEQVTSEASVTKTEQPADTLNAAQPQLFEEAPLDQVLTVLAAHYGVEVEYRTDDVRSLRLFYQWEPEYSLDKVVEMLNNFEAFSIRHVGNKLIVEPSSAKQTRP